MPRALRIGLALLAAMPVIGTPEPAPDRSFILETTSTQPYAPSSLGNGVISLVTSPLATEPARSFLAGVYDHTPGDVPRIASAPAWNEFGILDSHAAVEHYRQTLDMYNGVLRTGYISVTGEKRMGIQVEQFVSRDNPELAAARLTVTPQFQGRLTLRLPLRNWPPPHRYALEQIQTLTGEARTNPWAIWYPGQLNVSVIRIEHAVLSLLATAPGTGLRTGEAVALQWTGSPQVETRQDANSAEADLTIDLLPGRTYQFTKYVAFVNSPANRQAAVQSATAARAMGWDALLFKSTQAWHKLWEADILVEGDPKLQRALHSMLFYLIESTRADLNASLGPMGLSSAGYYGHIFWDADTFMFPALLVLHPELARPIVAFRSRTLQMARENAAKHAYRGAMYPWEAGPDGAETTPRFAAQNASSENHVNGDIALASWQYWQATADRDWLRNQCWPILRDTADFWVSRVHYNAQRGRYEISGLVAVNESEVGVSNDPYTNAIAKKNLELAIAAAAALHLEAHPKWKEVAGKMYVPDSNSALLWYPLDRSYSAQQTRQAIEAMLSRVRNQRSGAMMGTEFYPILAAQIGDRSAIGQLLGPLCFPYLRPPFQVIAETPRNENTNFLTGAGAFLQQFIFGYTGLRLGSNGLERKFRPTLPPGLRRVVLKNITVRGRRETLTFDPNSK